MLRISKDVLQVVVISKDVIPSTGVKPGKSISEGGKIGTKWLLLYTVS